MAQAPNPPHERSAAMRRFQLRRNVDHSGVSGSGVVAEGIIFTSGAVVMAWLMKPAGMTRVPKGLAVYEDVSPPDSGTWARR